VPAVALAVIDEICALHIIEIEAGETSQVVKRAAGSVAVTSV
jgi:hypothetical protein